MRNYQTIVVGEDGVRSIIKLGPLTADLANNLPHQQYISDVIIWSDVAIFSTHPRSRAMRT